ncbi:unnamed protein product [Lepidochelys olivacea]
MKLSLLLALLGAISARQLQQEVPAEQGEEELGELEPPCPMGSESFRMIVPSTEGHTCHYVFKLCARCYHGCLASIHSHSTNERLRCTAPPTPTGAGVDRRRHLPLGPPLACTLGGDHWRSVSCQTRLPFICKY